MHTNYTTLYDSEGVLLIVKIVHFPGFSVSPSTALFEAFCHLKCRQLHWILLSWFLVETLVTYALGSLCVVPLPRYLFRRWTLLGWILAHSFPTYSVSRSRAALYSKLRIVWKPLFAPSTTNHCYLITVQLKDVKFAFLICWCSQIFVEYTMKKGHVFSSADLLTMHLHYPVETSVSSVWLSFC